MKSITTLIGVLFFKGALAPIPGKKVFIKPIRKKEVDIIETLKQTMDDSSSTHSMRSVTWFVYTPKTRASFFMLNMKVRYNPDFRFRTRAVTETENKPIAAPLQQVR